MSCKAHTLIPIYVNEIGMLPKPKVNSLNWGLNLYLPPYIIRKI